MVTRWPVADQLALIESELVIQQQDQETKLSFHDWIAKTDPKFQFYTHVDKLIAVLQRVADGEIKRLMVFLPPRHGKSECISRKFSAYYLYCHPTRWVAITSYAAKLAYALSRSSRDHFTLGGGTLSSNAAAVQYWKTVHGGGLWAAGVGGSATGFGYNCFPGDTRVMTNYGIMKIETLCQSSDQRKVLSFNHATSQLEWQRIIATAVQPGKPLVEIAFTSGHRIRCTTDHAIYCLERGYRQAGHLVPGETVIQVSHLQDLCNVRNESEPSPALPSVRTRYQRFSLSNSLRLLRHRVYPFALSGREVHSKQRGRSILFQKVQLRSSRRQKSKALQGMWQSGREAYTTILQRVPPIQVADLAAIARNRLWILRENVSAQIPSNGILLQTMQKFCSRDSDARQGQQSLQDRDELRRLVPQDAPGDNGTGQPLLRDLWRDEFGNNNASPTQEWIAANSFAVGNSSYRSQSIQQSSHQPYYPLQCLSQVASPHHRCWQTDTISSVTRLGEIPHAVYDLQVEGNSNFFADGILVHNCGIIDDPLKDAEQAGSENIREKQKDWYRSVFSTREEPGGAIVIVSTRWHEADLSGWLLAQETDEDGEAEHWHIVNLPAIAEAAHDFPPTVTVEVDDRELGAALCPERYPLAKLKRLQKRIGEYFFNALFQGRPQPLDGDLFKRQDFTIIPAHPNTIWRVRYWDKAASISAASKYTAGVRLAITHDGRVIIEHVIRGQWRTAERRQVMLQTAQLDRQSVGEVITYIEQEPGSSGLDSVQDEIRLLMGYAVFADRPSGDKDTRMLPLSGQAQAGNVYLVAGAWNEDFIAELCAIPNGRYRDQADATSGAFNRIVEIINSQEEGTAVYQDRVSISPY